MLIILPKFGLEIVDKMEKPTEIITQLSQSNNNYLHYL